MLSASTLIGWTRNSSMGVMMRHFGDLKAMELTSEQKDVVRAVLKEMHRQALDDVIDVQWFVEMFARNNGLEWEGFDVQNAALDTGERVHESPASR